MEDEDVGERDTDGESLLSDSSKVHSSAVETKFKRKIAAFGYVQCYFFTIAVILGNGTVGLPRVLNESGFTVYVAVVLLQTSMQVLVVFYFVELLQRGYLAKRQLLGETLIPGDEDIPLNDVGGSVVEEEEEEEEEEEVNKPSDVEFEISKVGGTVPLPVRENYQNAVYSQPSLHTLAELFLCNGLRQIFEVIILLMFISLLISNALEASQLCDQLMNMNLVWIPAVLVWCSAFLTIFVNSLIVPFVSVLTFLNGCLFSTIAVCGSTLIGSQFNPKRNHSELEHVCQPLVLGTVALGVAVNILPVLFKKIRPSASQEAFFVGSLTRDPSLIWNIVWKQDCSIIRGFCWSVIAGIITCVVISVFWVARNGNISAILMSKIIKSTFPDYSWLAVLIQVLVIVSVTVSFLTVATGMKHFVDSWFESFYPTRQTNWQEMKSKWDGFYCRANMRRFLKVTILISLFGLVFAVATLNPNGTVTILKNFTSLTLNIELGVCIVLMLRRSHEHKFSHLRVPLPLLRPLYHLQYFVVAYFLVTLGFHVADIIQLLTYNQNSTSGVEFLANQTLTTFNITWNSSSLSDLHNRRWRINNILSTNETH